MTRLFPGSKRFEFQGRNVYARQVTDADDVVEFRHSSTSDVGTVSASLSILSARGLCVNHDILMHRRARLVVGRVNVCGLVNHIGQDWVFDENILWQKVFFPGHWWKKPVKTGNNGQ